MKYRFIDGQKGEHPVRAVCRVVKVDESGFYRWRRRKKAPDRRVPGNESELRRAILRIHRKSRGRYGRPRICEELERQGYAVGANRVRRIMLQLGLEGRSGRLRSSRRTRPLHVSASPNLLARNFEATKKNLVWVGDITQVRVRSEWHYICVVIDLFSRRVVGWNLSRFPNAALATGAMKKAARGHRRLDGLVFHSDQGLQYLSQRYREQLRTLGIRQSMSRRGNCWDNAPAESFFATLKKELIHTAKWTSSRVLRSEVDKYICYYNTQRLHSTLGYRSPKEYEQQLAA